MLIVDFVFEDSDNFRVIDFLLTIPQIGGELG